MSSDFDFIEEFTKSLTDDFDRIPLSNRISNEPLFDIKNSVHNTTSKGHASANEIPKTEAALDSLQQGLTDIKEQLETHSKVNEHVEKQLSSVLETQENIQLIKNLLRSITGDITRLKKQQQKTDLLEDLRESNERVISHITKSQEELISNINRLKKKEVKPALHQEFIDSTQLVISQINKSHQELLEKVDKLKKKKKKPSNDLRWLTIANTIMIAFLLMMMLVQYLVKLAK